MPWRVIASKTGNLGLGKEREESFMNESHVLEWTHGITYCLIFLLFWATRRKYSCSLPSCTTLDAAHYFVLFLAHTTACMQQRRFMHRYFESWLRYSWLIRLMSTLNIDPFRMLRGSNPIQTQTSCSARHPSGVQYVPLFMLGNSVKKQADTADWNMKFWKTGSSWRGFTTVVLNSNFQLLFNNTSWNGNRL